MKERDFVPEWEEGDFSLGGRRGIFPRVGEEEFFSGREEGDFPPPLGGKSRDFTHGEGFLPMV